MHKKLIITLTLCITLGAGYAFAQSRSTEGVSRQITAIKNMFESFANNMRPRVTDLERDIGGLLTEQQSRTGCFNKTSEPHMHWPTHPYADRDGCVAESVISSAGSDVLCNPSRPTLLLGGNKNCSECINDGGTLVDLRTEPEKQTGAPAELVCDFTGRNIPRVQYDWARVNRQVERYPRPSYMASRLVCPSGYTHKTSRGKGLYYFAPHRYSTGGCPPCSTGAALSHKMPSCRYESGSECGGSNTSYASTVTGIRCQ